MSESPLSSLNYSFSEWIGQKKDEFAKHRIAQNVWDYSYPVDMELRESLEKMPGLSVFAKKTVGIIVRQKVDEANRSWLAVSSHQFPEVYELGRDCAKRLGIAIPNIYVSNDNTFNAYTYALDDVEPMIVIGDLMLERYPLSELKCIIGHECGHIHNYHSLYNVLAAYLLWGGAVMTNRLLQIPGILLSLGMRATLDMWSRAAEVTADRAAMICCDSLEDAYRAIGKLMYASVKVEDKIDTKLDIEALRKQLDMANRTPGKLSEIFYRHPIIIKRIFAMMEFSQSETFYGWRPDFKQPGMIVRSDKEVNDACRQLISITGKDKKNGNRR